VSGGGVSALAVSGDVLYAGGLFRNAGGKPAKYIAMWDGAEWSSLGSVIDGFVTTLTASGTDLYVAGRWIRPLRWNGRRWITLGSPPDGGVEAIALSGNELFFGGDFNVIGGKVSAFVARGFLDGVPALEINGERATAFFREIPAGAYRIERTTDLKTWEPLATRYAGEAGGIDFTDEAPPRAAAYYRAVQAGP
jgi:hypothetical protein